MTSFIGSILNSIGGDGDKASTRPSKAPLAKPVLTTTTVGGQKRKAEGELQRSGDKAQKVGNTNGTIRSRDIKPLPHRSSTTSSFNTSNRPSNGTNLKSASTNGSGAKSSLMSSNGKSAVANTKPAVLGSRSVPASSAMSRSLNSPAPTASSSKPGTSLQTSSKPQPKKGSFKALLAQAEAARQVQQQKAGPVGAIVHKPTMSAKEMIAQAKKDKLLGPKGKSADAKTAKLAVNGKANRKAGMTRDGKDKSAAGVSGKYQGTARPKPARPQPTYTGTARPSVKPAPVSSGYKGTARPGAAPVSRTPAKPVKKYERDEYLGTDEEDEDAYGYDDESDHYAEASDDYSDMDAGFDDVDFEEREAERQAKMDDIREQKELERLAKEKAMRKKGGR